MSLPANALTDYATVAQDLGLSFSVSGGLGSGLPVTTGTDQALIERLIGAASSALENFCRRKFVFAAGLTEALGMRGGPRLLVERTPLVTYNAITTDFGTPQMVDTNLDDADMGSIWSTVGWPWSALIQWGRYDPNFTFDQQPGTEGKTVTVGYAGGYITTPQAYSASAWPGGTKTIDPGTLCIPAGQPLQLWMATATTAGSALVTGSVEPTWTVSPVAPKWGAGGSAIYTAFYGGSKVTDGAVTWLYLGGAGTAGARGSAVTLPDALEEACILTVKSLYRERRDNPNVKSESLLGASMSYDRTTGLPPQAMALAAEFRRAL